MLPFYELLWKVSFDIWHRHLVIRKEKVFGLVMTSVLVRFMTILSKLMCSL